MEGELRQLKWYNGGEDLLVGVGVVGEPKGGGGGEGAGGAVAS